MPPTAEELEAAIRSDVNGVDVFIGCLSPRLQWILSDMVELKPMRPVLLVPMPPLPSQLWIVLLLLLLLMLLLLEQKE